MKKTCGLFVVIVCLGIGTALFTKCGKDSGTNVSGVHDTLSIFTHDTLRIYSFDTIHTSSHDTILTSSHDTVLITTHDSITTYDTVKIYSYDTIHTSSHDTILTSSHDTILTSSHDTVLITTHDSITTYDTVTTYTYDTVAFYTYDTIRVYTYDTIRTYTYDTVKVYSDTTGYILTPFSTAGGTISPAVPVKVGAGDFQVFIIKPDIFYVLDSVTAEGVRLQVQALENPARSYSVYVLNVSKNMAIKAWFSPRPIYYGMKPVPAGSFLMGRDSIFQTAGIVNTWKDTVHQVTLSAFSMDTTEVTQAEYKSLMGYNPSAHTGDSLLPVETVTWFDAVLYCNKRSKMEDKDTVYSYTYVAGVPGNGCTALLNLAIDYTKKGYRLPTEAEWEYACRGGSTTNYWWGNDTNGMGARTWSEYNSVSTQRVATKLENAYGLYDMTGNVREWCNDWYGNYTSNSQTDPTGPATGTYRPRRGGSYSTFDNYITFRSVFRGAINPDISAYMHGFRVVLPQ